MVEKCDICGGLAQVKRYEFDYNDGNNNPGTTLCVHCQLLCLDVMFQLLGFIVKKPVIIRRCNEKGSNDNRFNM